MPTLERPVLLVVEDDPGLQRQMQGSFERYNLVFADSRESAIAGLRRHEPAVVTLDLGLPAQSAMPTEGFRTLEEILALEPSTKVIALTEYVDDAHAARAIAMGATDLFEKPFDADSLGLIIDRAFRVAGLERENRRLAESRSGRGIGDILTRDPVMLRLCRQIGRLATVSNTVLLTGESGTGKQLVARALHLLSNRRDGPFVALNCATVPAAQLEEELFCATGLLVAGPDRSPGGLDAAAGGTLFLDEIGELSKRLQARLLQFLQQGPGDGPTDGALGARADVGLARADVRLVCATNSDLHSRIEQGSFREDLFYRLSEVGIALPPLRERAGDATLLAHSFLRRFGANHRRDRLWLTDGALHAIENHTWPGNVRELENCIKRAIIMAEGNAITSADLGLLGSDEAPSLNLRRIRDEAERQAVLKVIARTNGNIARAAELLGVSRPTLYDLLNRFGLR